MSNYSSDQTLDVLWNGPYRLDVADSCMGEDVRILLDGRSAYLSPDEARLVAAALFRAAEATEEWGAAWERGLADPAPVPPATTGGTDEAEGLAELTRVVLRQRLIDRNLPTEGRGYMEDERALAACEPVARAVLASDWLRERDLARDARTRAEHFAASERILRDARAAAWDEGHFACGCPCHTDETCLNCRNPYRADQIGGAS